MRPIDKEVDFTEPEGDEVMAQEYGRFECKICGSPVFAPLFRLKDGQQNSTFYELTCSNGHTDTYDLSKFESVQAKPVRSLHIRRAVAGIG
jgi:hypothetical protein